MAQTANPSQTSQGSGSQQRASQTGLARRNALPSVPSLLLDPLAMFDDSPFSMLRRMQQEINRAFGGAGTSGQTANPEAVIWAPRVEVTTDNNKLVISAELPGLSENDVEVDIEDEVLVIQGERKVEQEREEGGVRRTERQYGRFYRAFALPDGADRSQIRAELQNGVLRITIPISQQQSNTQRIPVQSSGSQQPSTSQQTQTGSEQSSPSRTKAA
jgi:HSP20 family protein